MNPELITNNKRMRAKVQRSIIFPFPVPKICPLVFVAFHTHVDEYIKASCSLFVSRFLRQCFLPQTLNTCTMLRKILLKSIGRLCLELFREIFLERDYYESSCPLTMGMRLNPEVLKKNLLTTGNPKCYFRKHR